MGLVPRGCQPSCGDGAFIQKRRVSLLGWGMPWNNRACVTGRKCSVSLEEDEIKIGWLGQGEVLIMIITTIY